MKSPEIDLDRPMTPAQFARWINATEGWVRRHADKLPGIQRVNRKFFRIWPRKYLEGVTK